jgi:hypothetical protein
MRRIGYRAKGADRERPITHIGFLRDNRKLQLSSSNSRRFLDYRVSESKRFYYLKTKKRSNETVVD